MNYYTAIPHAGRNSHIFKQDDPLSLCTRAPRPYTMAFPDGMKEPTCTTCKRALEWVTDLRRMQEAHPDPKSPNGEPIDKKKRKGRTKAKRLRSSSKTLAKAKRAKLKKTLKTRRNIKAAGRS